MTASVLLYVDHLEIGGRMEWNMSAEESLGGTGRATITVQDRDMDWEPAAHMDVRVILASGDRDGHMVFRGEIITFELDLPVAFPWRTWKLDCADYSGEFSQRKIGALDGRTWIDQSGLGIFVNIDQHAATLRTDKLTIKNWLNHYVRVDATADIGTDTYVQELLTDFTTITPTYTDVQSALEELAALVAGNLQFWLDPDLEFHWTLIPSWRDVLQFIIDTTGAGPEASTSALLFAETPDLSSFGLEMAPYDISDVRGTPGYAVGGSKLKLSFDGKEMPEQVYVRGGTGYVYNAPPIPPVAETKVVDDAPIPGAEGTYQVTVVANNTKIWHVDSTGYISLDYDLSSPGGPWPVKFVHVPWNEDRHKGGYFWKFTSGPWAGKLVDDHTNNLSGYGEILVELVPAGSGETPPAKIGTGGSGWVNEVIQQRAKRQAYLDAPVSVTRALRDSLGGQVVYRGLYETLRGTITVNGYEDANGVRQSADGWRVGQLVRIIDARLPSGMNGLYYVIQRVQTKLIKGTTVREYVLDFGDGAVSRYSYQAARRRGAEWPPPANMLWIDAHDLTPGPNSSQTITGQLVNSAGEPWAIAGKVVEWTFEAYNASGVLQSGQGSILPAVSVTDNHGKARTTLKTGSGLNLVYFVFGSVRAV